jgi:hypothetical protein
MSTDELVERVARAIANANSGDVNPNWRMWMEHARAAIEATGVSEAIEALASAEENMRLAADEHDCGSCLVAANRAAETLTRIHQRPRPEASARD